MSVRRTSESLQSSIGQRTCLKHPERFATHQLANKGGHNDVYYCEKCSIMLASQGYNVIKLSSVSPITARKGSVSSRNSKGSVSRQHSILSNRKNQISSFIDNLQNINFQLTHKIDCIQQFLIKSEIQHGRMIEQANKFYKQIQQIIELQKYTTYNSILNKRTLDEAKARSLREAVLEACQQVQAIIGDIRQNMDAVQTVDYSIYNAIMGGYQVKSEKLKMVLKQPFSTKVAQKYEVILPEIPKIIYTLSDKISILIKKSPSVVSNSMPTSTKVMRIPTQQQGVCMSQSDSQIIEQQRPTQNKLDKYPSQQLDFNPKQILNSRANRNELAFSFDQNSINSKQLKINEDLNMLDNSRMVIRGFQQGKLSKISERLNSKQVYESRQSLGQYLNISNSRDRHLNQDTQTLLIA